VTFEECAGGRDPQVLGARLSIDRAAPIRAAVCRDVRGLWGRSPFLPAFVRARGLSAEQLGLVLSAGTAVRLLTAPLAGRTGDVLQGLRLVLVVCTALAAAVTLG
jgi:hypothetical protein